MEPQLDLLEITVLNTIFRVPIHQFWWNNSSRVTQKTFRHSQGWVSSRYTGCHTLTVSLPGEILPANYTTREKYTTNTTFVFDKWKTRLCQCSNPPLIRKFNFTNQPMYHQNPPVILSSRRIGYHRLTHGLPG